MASSGRRFPPSVSAAFAEWVAAAGGGDLSLGFNAGAAPASAVWAPAAASRQSAAALNYGIAAAGDFVLSPAAASSSFHHQTADPGFALLSAGLVDPDAAASNSKPGTAIQFWQPPTAAAGAADDTKKPVASVMASVGGSGGASCNDCGNQAKKDCPYQRCRTCCKSQGFDCTTHVRSTWIPAASRRRDRQNPAGPNGDDSASGLSPSSSKKARRLLSCQTTTTNSRTQSTSSRSFDATSTQQEAPFMDSLPRYVRAPAVFRCVRVTPVDDGGGGGGVDELAYQASVTINGHMFRGFLYDQGRGNVSVDESSSHAAAVRSISDLHLGTAVSASSAVPPGVYDAVGSAQLILGGLSYGNTIN